MGRMQDPEHPLCGVGGLIPQFQLFTLFLSQNALPGRGLPLLYWPRPRYEVQSVLPAVTCASLLIQRVSASYWIRGLD